MELWKSNALIHSIHFNISTFLAFLICLRKLVLLVSWPTQDEFNVMQHLVKNLVRKGRIFGFPPENQIEEDIKTVLDLDKSDREICMLQQFLINHLEILEFCFNLSVLTTKESNSANKPMSQ